MRPSLQSLKTLPACGAGKAPIRRELDKLSTMDMDSHYAVAQAILELGTNLEQEERVDPIPKALRVVVIALRSRAAILPAFHAEAGLRRPWSHWMRCARRAARRRTMPDRHWPVTHAPRGRTACTCTPPGWWHSPRCSLAHTRRAAPQTSDLRPQTSDLRPQTSHLRPQTSDLRPQAASRPAGAGVGDAVGHGVGSGASGRRRKRRRDGEA